MHLPDADEPPGADLVLIEPDEIEDLVVRELSGSALFGARFRENAARALLLPRAYPGKRTPLWQQRLKAQSLLEVAKRYGQFPIVLETYRECLRDVLDLPALQDLLRGLHTRELSLVEVETQRASPFASSLLFDYVATYMYEGDTPNAERRAAALSLDRDLLRELLGQEELRELIDPDALAEVEADLQRRSERTRAANADGLHDVLRAVGDLTVDEAQERCLEAVSARRMLGELEEERRAVRCGSAARSATSRPRTPASTATRFGAVPPGGLPAVFVEEVPEPMARLARRYARTHGPFTSRAIGDRYAVDFGPGAARARARGRPGARRAAARRLGARVVRPGGAAAPAARLAGVAAQGGGAGRPAGAGAAAARLAGRGLLAARRRGGGPAARGARAAPGRWRWRPRCGSATCCRAAWAPTRSRGWTSSARAASSCGWAPGRSGARRAGWRSTSATTPAGSARRRTSRSARRASCTRRSARGSRPGAAFWTDLVVDLDVEPVELQEALWDLVWAGEVTNDAFAPLRAPRLSLAAKRSHQSGRRFARRRRPSAPQVQGRWSLTAPLFAGAPAHGPRMRALAELMLERYGIVTRETVLAEGVPGGFATLYGELANLETLGTARRGYFVEGLGGAQFALAPRWSACAACAPTSPPARWCWRPPTPPTPTAPRCRGPSATTTPAAAPRAWRAPTWSRSTPSRCSTWSAAARACCPLGTSRGRRRALRTGCAEALDALAAEVRRGRVPRLGIERFDGEPVIGLADRRAADRAGLPPGPAAADAERLTRRARSTAAASTCSCASRGPDPSFPPADGRLVDRRRPARPAPDRRVRASRAAVSPLRQQTVRSRGQGDDNRTTYWCPGCQR